VRAITFADFGRPEVLQLGEVRTPEPKVGDVLVRVEAAGVCRHDILHRAGMLPGSPAGAVLGHEIAGQVAETGPGVTGVGPGDRVLVYHKVVCGTCQGCVSGRTDLCRSQQRLGTHRSGGYAEFVVVPARNLVRVPAGVSSTAAALAVCPMGTSLRALRAAGADLGMTVAVVGAAGGLGVHQIQIARAAGLRVLAVTRTARWAEQLRELGAAACVVAPDGSPVRAIRHATGGDGAHIVLDNVVSGTLGTSLRALRPGGAVVVLGNMEVRDIPIRPGLLIYRRLRIIGSGTPTIRDVRDVLTMLADGAVHAVVAEEFPLASAAAAHDRLERGSVLGRIVLKP
jgi:D-arabinose 1-dehydrogenase-like Zn-dependent alcohol dehydrogenase